MIIIPYDKQHTCVHMYVYLYTELIVLCGV